MSRCFPFPPPGYEKKARTEDTDLLTKEKHKEKRHKKDKKDKEKREGKEKKDKERSKDKHKEKKDRKERHKEKDKDRDKEKTQISAEKRVEKQPECPIGENVGTNSRQSLEIKDSKHVQELAKRIRDEDRATGSQTVQNAVGDQRSAILLERVVESNTGNQFKEKEKTKDDRKINGFRNHIDARILENEVVRNSSGMDKKNVDANARPVDQNNVDKKIDAKEKNKHNGSGSKGEKHKDRDREKKSKSKDKDRDKEKEKKEKVKKTEQSKEQPRLKDSSKDMTGTCIIKTSNHLLNESTKISVREGNLGARKEIEMKREPSKEQPQLKESNKQSPITCIIKTANSLKESPKTSAGEGILGKRKELEMKKEPKIKESSKDMPGTSIVKSSNLVKESTKSFAGEGNLGKRKEFEMNGILHDNGIRPNKSPRHVSSFHPVLENGRKMEPCQTANQVDSERQGAASNLRVEIKGHRINGSIDAQPPKVSSKRPSSAAVQVNENGEVCGKPPHPDSKYLNQILSVPKVEECPDFDDQEWLFGSNNLQSKKPKVGSPGDGTPEVWAEALQIECADVCALPYVIPY